MSPVRFWPKPRQLKSMWIWANRPSSKGSKLLFPVIKAIKKKNQHQSIRNSLAALLKALFTFYAVTAIIRLDKRFSLFCEKYLYLVQRTFLIRFQAYNNTNLTFFFFDYTGQKSRGQPINPTLVDALPVSLSLSQQSRTLPLSGLLSPLFPLGQIPIDWCCYYFVKNSLETLLQVYLLKCKFEFSIFGVFAGIESAISGQTVPRSDQLN